MRKATIIIAVLLSMACTATAGMYRVPHKPFSKMTLAQVEQYQLRVITYDRWVIRTAAVHDPHVVWWHRQQLKWTQKELQETRRKMTPPISHYAGWHCITYGAYPGAPHEGHGYNGPYAGALQMTNPWMCISADWAHMSDSAVYAIADRVARRYGYSYSFMKGQWPNTYPPCARYF
jgi:hypothetical protein